LVAGIVHDGLTTVQEIKQAMLATNIPFDPCRDPSGAAIDTPTGCRGASHA
jgi:hypothetical protein